MCHKCGIMHFITVRKQAACAVFKVLAHDSVPFHPTSSSSLRRKRKDERKHKKRSVCDCESCTLQNLHNSFDPPSSISSSFAIVSPSTLFRTFIAEGKKKDPPKCSHEASTMGEHRNMQLLFFWARLEKKPCKGENWLKAWATKSRKIRGERG